MTERNRREGMEPADLTLQEQVAALMRQAALDRPLAQKPAGGWADLHPAIRSYWMERAIQLLALVAALRR